MNRVPFIYVHTNDVPRKQHCEIPLEALEPRPSLSIQLALWRRAKLIQEWKADVDEMLSHIQCGNVPQAWHLACLDRVLSGDEFSWEWDATQWHRLHCKTRQYIVQKICNLVDLKKVSIEQLLKRLSSPLVWQSMCVRNMHLTVLAMNDFPDHSWPIWFPLNNPRIKDRILRNAPLQSYTLKHWKPPCPKEHSILFRTMPKPGDIESHKVFHVRIVPFQSRIMKLIETPLTEPLQMAPCVKSLDLTFGIEHDSTDMHIDGKRPSNWIVDYVLDALVKCPSLTSLKVEYTTSRIIPCLSVSGIRCIQTCPLQSLYLENVCLPHDTVSMFTTMIEHCVKSLQELTLVKIGLDTDETMNDDSLVDMLCKCSNLCKLRIETTRLVNGSKLIAQISALQRLESLTLKNVPGNPSHFDEWADQINRLPLLESLKLDPCYEYASHRHSEPCIFRHSLTNPRLAELHIFHGILDAEFVKHLSKSVVCLELRCQALTDSCIRALMYRKTLYTTTVYEWTNGLPLNAQLREWACQFGQSKGRTIRFF